MSNTSYSAKKPLGITEASTLSAKVIKEREVLILAIAKQVPFFEKKSVASVTSVSWRPFSSGALINCTDNSSYFLKIFDLAVRPIARLKQEHRFMSHLRKNGISIPSVLACQEISHQDKSYSIEVFSPLKGIDKYINIPSWSPFLNPNDALASGQMLAKLHKASEGFKETTQFQLLTSSLPKARGWSQFYAELKNFCLSSPYLKPSYEKLVKNQGVLQTVINPYLKKLSDTVIPQTLWIHGDWHPSNLSWIENRLLEVFDFSMSAQQSKNFGIAVAIERSFIDWLSPKGKKVMHTALLETFIKGYKSRSPFKPSDCESICAFLPLSHIQFALSEYAFYINNNEADKAHIVWNDYLIGHCKYFASPDGHLTLEQLHRLLLNRES